MFSKGHASSRPPSWSTLFPHLAPSSPPPQDPLPRYTPLPSASDASLSPLSAQDEKPPLPAPHAHPERRRHPLARRKLILCILAALGLALVGLSGFALSGRQWEVRLPEWADLVDGPPVRIPGGRGRVDWAPPEELDAVDDEWEEGVDGVRKAKWSPWVKGPPTAEFRQNLHRDVKYITGFIAAGWTNDVMSLASLILLGLLTQRVPILPPWQPSHLPRSAGFPSFGTVFDVARLAEAIHSPVLEWEEVKNVTGGGTKEWLGCWSVWMGSGDRFGHREGNIPKDILNLDISWTPIPTSYRFHPNTNDPHVSLPSLSHLSFPSGRSHALSQSRPIPSPQDGVVIEPDGELMCFDFTYYTGMEASFEWGLEWSAQWNMVGRHMRWARPLESLARSYLKRHFGVKENEAVPPYISAHIRRGDFLNNCGPNPKPECMPSLLQLSVRIGEVQRALLRHSPPIDTSLVLITSDESSPAWWDSVTSLGYTYVNHTALGTAEVHGKWYEPWLDAVFQSLGSGFVGTDGSTMSLLAERRVKEWGGGEAARLWFGVRDEDLVGAGA